jgi:hypothetical protein
MSHDADNCQSFDADIERQARRQEPRPLGTRRAFLTNGRVAWSMPPGSQVGLFYLWGVYRWDGWEATTSVFGVVVDPLTRQERRT